MIVRTEAGTAHHVEIPVREQVNEELQCPPHAFDQGWGLAPGDDLHADTVPVLYCASCGDIRLMRVPG